MESIAPLRLEIPPLPCRYFLSETDFLMGPTQIYHSLVILHPHSAEDNQGLRRGDRQRKSSRTSISESEDWRTIPVGCCSCWPLGSPQDSTSHWLICSHFESFHGAWDLGLIIWDQGSPCTPCVPELNRNPWQVSCAPSLGSRDLKGPLKP